MTFSSGTSPIGAIRSARPAGAWSSDGVEKKQRQKEEKRSRVYRGTLDLIAARFSAVVRFEGDR